MRVLCIVDSKTKNEKTLTVKNGSVYNVTKVVRDKFITKYNTDVWYELLETGKSLHLGALFVLEPIEDEATTVSRKILEIASMN